MSKIFAVLWKNSLFYKQTCYWLLVILFPILCLSIFRIIDYLSVNKEEIKNLAYFTSKCTDLKLSPLNISDINPTMNTTLMYAPRNNLTDQLIENIRTKNLFNKIQGFNTMFDIRAKFYSMFELNRYKHQSNLKLENILTHPNGKTSEKVFGIVFHLTNESKWPEKFQYDILSSKSIPIYLYTDIHSIEFFDDEAFTINKTCSDTNILQILVDNAFITAVTSNDTYYEDYNNKIKINNFPIKMHRKTGTATEIFFINFLRSCIIIYIVASIVRDEKETGLKEVIVAAGISRCKQEMCLFIIFYLPIAASIILESLLMTGWSDYLSYIFVVTNLYIISCIFTGMFIGNIGTTSFGVLCCILVWIISGFLQYLSITYDLRSVCKILLTDLVDIILLIIPPNCYYTILIYLEIISRLAPEGNNNSLKSQQELFSIKPSFRLLILLLILSTLIMILLLWYIEQVFTGIYGTPKKFYFFLTKKYWFKDDKYEDEGVVQEIMYEMGVEQPSKSMRLSISMRGVSKKIGKNEVLKGINLDVLKKVMTVILGPNGSGKTILLRLMAGLMAPSRGQITFSYDKSKIGYCSTYNMFFSRMTVIQHVKFFAMLRGVSFTLAQDEAKSTLEYFDIESKIFDSYCDNLSVTNQRKLSIAMATVGSCQILVLDEPTAGIDSMTKTEIWQKLSELKGLRSVIIATQNSLEAETFADRIIILNDGNILCHGSLTFLRYYYDTGYILKVIVDQSDLEPEYLLSIVQEYIPNAKIKFILPKKISIFLTRVRDILIVKLMTTLEDRKEELKISEFSFTKMNLEDIYLKSVGVKIHHHRRLVNPVEKYDNVTNNRFKLYFQQILALIFEQLLFIYNQWPTVTTLLCISISITLFSSYTSQIYWSNIGKVSVSLSLYDDAYVYNGINDTVFSNNIKQVIDGQFKEYVQTNDFLKDINGFIAKYPFLYDSKFVVGFDEGPSLLFSPRTVYGSYIGVNILSNAYLRQKLPDKNYSININIIAAENGTLGTYHVEVLDAMVTFIVLIFILIKQREEYSTGVRKLQIVAGVPKILYWVTNYLVDNVFFLLNTIIVYSVKCFFYKVYLGFQLKMEILNLYVLLPFVYCLSVFRINIGIMTLLCFLIIPQYIYTFVHIDSNFNPMYLGWFPGLTKTVACYLHSVHHTETLIGDFHDINNYVFLKIILIQGILMWVIFIFIDNDFYGMLFYKQFDLPYEPDDIDVVYEDHGCKRLIRYLHVKENRPLLRSNLFVHQLVKFYRSPYKYPSSAAVKYVSFATEIGTIFGIVGTNNSGKSTVIKLLIGEDVINSGQIYMFKKKLNWFTRFRFQSHIGYCPEIPAVFNSLTGKQMLLLMAMIKGISLSKVNRVANWWLDQLDTSDSGNKRIRNYTPGMKKRLSFAISLIGNVPILILDEPTEGVDPGGKGQIRRLIRRMKNPTRTILMTTQNIDECEAMCDKMAIMNYGSVRCIGDVKYLKDKYLEGYTATIICSVISHDFIESILNLVPEHFQCKFKRKTNTSIIFVVSGDVKQSEVFHFFEDLAIKYPEIIDISVHHTTLNELYYSIKQRDEEAED